MVPQGDLVRSWSESIVNPPLDQPVVRMTRLAPAGERLPEGIYLLRVTAPGSSGSETMPIVDQQRQRRDEVDAPRRAGVDGRHAERRAARRHAIRRAERAGRPSSRAARPAATAWHVSTRRRLPTATSIPATTSPPQSAGRVVLSGTQWSNGINPGARAVVGGVPVHAAGPRRLPVHRPADLPPRRDRVLQGRRAQGRRRALLAAARHAASDRDQRRPRPRRSVAGGHAVRPGHIRREARAQRRGRHGPVLRGA